MKFRIDDHWYPFNFVLSLKSVITARGISTYNRIKVHTKIHTNMKNKFWFLQNLHVQHLAGFSRLYFTNYVLNLLHVTKFMMNPVMTQFIHDLAYFNLHTVCIKVCDIPYKTEFRRNTASKICPLQTQNLSELCLQSWPVLL